MENKRDIKRNECLSWKNKEKSWLLTFTLYILVCGEEYTYISPSFYILREHTFVSSFPSYLKIHLKYPYSWIRSIITQWMIFFIILRKTDGNLCLLSTESKGQEALELWAVPFVYSAWPPAHCRLSVLFWGASVQLFWRSGLCSTHLLPHSLWFSRIRDSTIELGYW